MNSSDDGRTDRNIYNCSITLDIGHKSSSKIAHHTSNVSYTWSSTTHEISYHHTVLTITPRADAVKQSYMEKVLCSSCAEETNALRVEQESYFVHVAGTPIDDEALLSRFLKSYRRHLLLDIWKNILIIVVLIGLTLGSLLLGFVTALWILLTSALGAFLIVRFYARKRIHSFLKQRHIVCFINHPEIAANHPGYIHRRWLLLVHLEEPSKKWAIMENEARNDKVIYQSCESASHNPNDLWRYRAFTNLKAYMKSTFDIEEYVVFHI